MLSLWLPSTCPSGGIGLILSNYHFYDSIDHGLKLKIDICGGQKCESK